MKLVDPKGIRFKSFSGKSRPLAIPLVCPYCSVDGHFSVDAQPNSVNGPPMTSRCPGCQHIVRFWMTGEPNDETEWLFVHPDPQTRDLIPEAEAVGLPEGVVEAYRETVRALNARLWPSAAVNARRTLEGVAKHASRPAAKKKRLAELLKDLENHVDLARPIKEVAELVKDGGNLAAHFDLDSPPPDEDMARGLVQLLDDLIEYLYVLPTRASRIRTKLEDGTR